MMDIESELSKMLRAARKAKGLTFKKLAEITGVSKAALQAIETRPGYGPPKAQTLEKIAVVLGLDVNAVLNAATLLNSADSPDNLLIGGINYTKIFILGNKSKLAFAPFKTEYIERLNLNPETLKSYKVESNVMDPVFKSGSTVFLETDIKQGFEAIEDGACYLFNYKKRSYVRQLFVERETVFIQCESEKVRDFELTSDEFKEVELVGRVLERFYYHDWL